MLDHFLSKLVAAISGTTVAAAAVPITGSFVTAAAAGSGTALMVNEAAKTARLDFDPKDREIIFKNVWDVSKPHPVEHFGDLNAMLADANHKNAHLVYGSGQERGARHEARGIRH